VASEDARARLRALRLRGAARTVLGRAREAIDDLRAARRHAEALGDAAAAVALLVDEATALDWCEDFAGAARVVNEAIARGGDPESPPLLLGRGRAALRRGDLGAAASLLGRAGDAAADHETRAAALNTLAAVLVMTGRRDEAEVRFRQVIATCQAAGDLRNLCAAYANRVLLLTARGLPEQAEDDLRRTLALAREIGSPLAERAATHNLAELLFAGGDDVESLRLARRAADLEAQLVEQPMPENSVLLARIHAARGELDDARRCLAGVSPSPTVRLLVGALELALAEDGGAPAAWDALLAEAAGDPAPEERVEILVWRAVAAARHGRGDEARAARVEAAAVARAWPMWTGRVGRV
jgi:eukaryotic-like serine/threonine-protein kinase